MLIFLLFQALNSKETNWHEKRNFYEETNYGHWWSFKNKFPIFKLKFINFSKTFLIFEKLKKYFLEIMKSR
jgi:hypothetical protein